MFRNSRISSISHLNSLLDHGLLLGLSGQGIGGGADDHGLGTKDSPTLTGLTITGNSVFGLNSSVFQPTTDSTTFFQVLDAAGNVVGNFDTTNMRFGIRTASPGFTLDVTGEIQAHAIGARNTTNNALLLENSPGLDVFRIDTANTATDSVTDVVRGKFLVSLGNVGFGEQNPETLLEMTGASPYATLHNSTHEDTDGGGEVRIIGKREDGAGTETAAGQIEISHDGSGANNQYGKIVESVNTGAGLVAARKVDSSTNWVINKTSGVGIKVDLAAPTFGWRDLEGFEIPDPTGGDRPTLSTYSGGLIKENAFSNGDVLRIRYHIPHDYVKGTDIFSHIHWSHNGTAISGNVVFGVTSDYAKGHNQANFGTEKSISITYATTDISTTPRYRHRIEESAITNDGGSATLIDKGLLEPDGIILVTFEVTTNPTITGGSPNNVFVHRADLHYQSTNIATKDKAPDFYT